MLSKDDIIQKSLKNYIRRLFLMYRVYMNIYEIIYIPAVSYYSFLKRKKLIKHHIKVQIS